MKNRQLKTLKLKFTVLEFFEDFVVSTLSENTIFEQKCVDELIKTCLAFYGEQSFVYISQRKADYNVDPTIYLNLAKVKPIKGIAIVTESSAATNMANFEKKFSPVPYEIFFEMEDAMEWAVELVKNKKADL